MSIKETYAEDLLETIIREILNDGIPVTVGEIQTRYDKLVVGKDLASPLFDILNADVSAHSNASATIWNNSNHEIHRDLRIAYKEMFRLTDLTITTLDRWRTQSLALEAQLRSLTTRIDDLIRTQIHLGTHYISDEFNDLSKTDLTNSTAYVNLRDGNVSLNVSRDQPNKLNLNYIKNEDILFTVLSRNALQGVSTAPGAELSNAFDDRNNFWQSRVVVTNAQQPVTCELKVKISDSPIAITKISIILHAANANSGIQITPLTSIDGINYTQLQSNNLSVNVIDKAAWTFPLTTASHIKFIMTKNGYDFSDNQSYVYEFGAQDISFYNLEFDPAQAQVVISQALAALDVNKDPIGFNSISLQTCEDIPPNTKINYFVAALSAPTDPSTWVPVDPVNKEQAIYPNQINFGSVTNAILSDVGISYDSKGTIGFVNPGKIFTLITLSSGNLINTLYTSTETRYVLLSSNDRLLSHEIDGSIDIVDGSIEIFRNKGARGDTTKVRNVQRGWTVEGSYYVTVVEIKAVTGFQIDFGDQEVIVDNVFYKGKVTIPFGIHKIKVKNTNWINISAGKLSLDELKAADLLFPFNHKHLIEGYTLADPGNPYIGVDLFAGYYMAEISISDFINNITADDYSKFAVDKDTAQVSKVLPSTVFVIKCNENYSDFLDELFLIRFDIKNQLYKYIKLKAELSTTNPSTSPRLDSYKLKLSS